MLGLVFDGYESACTTFSPVMCVFFYFRWYNTERLWKETTEAFVPILEWSESSRLLLICDTVHWL